MEGYIKNSKENKIKIVIMEEEKFILTKEQALQIANIKNEHIYNFISISPALIGADCTRTQFLEILENADSIEVGGKQCRAMGHALVIWDNNRPYFFEHIEEELLRIEREK